MMGKMDDYKWEEARKRNGEGEEEQRKNNIKDVGKIIGK